jgi:hypothetical protein
MASGSQESRAIEAPLGNRVSAGADAAQIAAAVGVLWQEIETALAPILGQQGVAALFGRSLHLTGLRYTWMVSRREGVPSVMDLTTLKAAFSRQSSAEAAAAGSALLQAFYELLSSLVGPSLTERLLRSIWEQPISGSPAQDTSP